MTGVEGSSSLEPEGPARPWRLVEDLALSAIALIVLVVPAFLRDYGAHPGVVTARTVRPIKINARSAPWYEWTLLDGIGENRARAIVQWREERGGIQSLEDLKGVPGLPAGWLEKALPLLELDNGHAP